MNLFLGWIILLVNLSCLKASNDTQKPHIVLIYADDLGWNDVSFHGSPQIPTPNIDALALNGITLQNYYGEWLCTPSRAALLTGKYPMRLGLQHFVILGGEASGLPLNETTMPQRFKEFGYETHMIGKWHLGYQTKEYTPTYRGFDTFYGYWNGLIDYFDHTYLEDSCATFAQPIFGMDFHDGLDPVLDSQGKYATHVFTERAEEIIMNHDTSKPLFMYFAQLAAHAGNPYQRSQAPEDAVNEFGYIDDLGRRIHAGIVKVMDDSVGAVFKALYQRDMLKNTIFLFVADNGGEINPKLGHGSNYPLRGNKFTYWEGGIHLPAVIWSPLLNLKKSRISHQLMHVSDWLPTLYTRMGGNVEDLGPIDGIDMWQALVNDTPSPRTNMLQNLDSLSGLSAYRQGDLKLTTGGSETNYSFWHGHSGKLNSMYESMYEWVFKNGSVVRDILQEMGMWIVEDPDDMYKGLTVTCEKPPPPEAYLCDPTKKSCLFNITADPCEYFDIADQNTDTVNEMWVAIKKYQSEEMKPQTKPCDPSANPMCHHFQYVPWLDPNFYKNCNLTTLNLS
ncbi:arylsulfatase B-like [Argiope bruennichi]|uniref:arylsulfatase B-like n=1 Tax=Argiope bruennichi TaxID=94029 RepID=UPI00249430DF|nr:arylsulfatase B-like [Argiope bruennichi]XP_055939884.1 arylsulfatase B-like [Argiope bruennichi]